MRRKSDMWSEFLPDEEVQEAQATTANILGRLDVLEEQLRSQFTSMATYAQIAQQAVENARAEARADLDRERGVLLGLIEQVREGTIQMTPAPSLATMPPPAVPSFPAPSSEPANLPAPAPDAQLEVSALARIAVLEDRIEELTEQFHQMLRSQQHLAESLQALFAPRNGRSSAA
jgi:phage shock protein A